MKLPQIFTRLMVMICICGFITFANIVPAIAAQSNLSKGTQQLPNIQNKAQDALNEPLNPAPYSSGKVEYQSKGLNEVQGTADYNKMSHGANTDTPPAVEQLEQAFDQIGDKVNSAKDDTQDGVNSALEKVGDTAGYIKDKAGDAFKSVTGKS